MAKQHIFSMSDQYEEYLIDESKFCGHAESVSFPESEEDIIEILRELAKEQVPVTIQGGKTGITGGAVPQGGHIMNLSHMNRFKESELLEDGTGRITVEAGMNLIDLRKEITGCFKKTPLFFPPDPTETSATIGGIIASGAQGISRLYYGKTGEYVEGIRLIDYAGNVHEIRCGQKLTLSSGREIEALEAALAKEGITGIISEVTLKLIPKPESLWGIAFFFTETIQAGAFADTLKEELPSAEDAAIVSVEYLDKNSMDLIEARKETMTKIKELPDVSEETAAMVYTEIHGTEEGIEEIAEALMEAAMECGSDPDEAWAVSGESEVEKLHAFRHGAPETVNLFVEEKHREDERITKLGTDMAIGEQNFSEVLKTYEDELETAGLNGCIFGHALENHLHINLLVENYEEYEKAVECIRTWAAKAKEKHNSIITEHGIGKLKRQILGDIFTEEDLSLYREVKEEFDHEKKLNPGNVFA